MRSIILVIVHQTPLIWVGRGLTAVRLNNNNNNGGKKKLVMEDRKELTQVEEGADRLGERTGDWVPRGLQEGSFGHRAVKPRARTHALLLAASCFLIAVLVVLSHFQISATDI